MFSDPGFEFDLVPEEDLFSLSEAPETPPCLERLLQEVTSLRLHLLQGDTDDSAQADWLALCSKVDLILFRVYLLVLTLYTVTLLLLWASWSSV